MTHDASSPTSSQHPQFIKLQLHHSQSVVPFIHHPNSFVGYRHINLLEQHLVIMNEFKADHEMNLAVPPST
jgi:hypothetical protein